MNSRSESIEVRVDPQRCGAIGLCVRDLPELFRFQSGSKRVAALFGRVPQHLVRRLLAAAESCPYRAIVLSRREQQSADDGRE